MVIRLVVTRPHFVPYLDKLDEVVARWSEALELHTRHPDDLPLPRVHDRGNARRRPTRRIIGETRDPAGKIAVDDGTEAGRSCGGGEELRDRDSEDIRDLPEGAYGRIGHAAFDLADVAGREFGSARQFAQAQLLLPTRGTDPFAGVLVPRPVCPPDMFVTLRSHV